MFRGMRNISLIIGCLFLLGHSLWPHIHRTLNDVALTGTHIHPAGDLEAALTHAFSIYQGEGHLTSYSVNEDFTVNAAGTEQFVPTTHQHQEVSQPLQLLAWIPLKDDLPPGLGPIHSTVSPRAP